MLEESEKIEKQIKTIAIFYFVFAGLTFLMLLMLPLHYAMMNKITEMDFPRRGGGPNPAEMVDSMMEMMIYMYIGMGVLGLLYAGLTFLTGLFLLQKKNRIFCLVGAGFCCTSFPLGTALGVWTLIVLMDEKAKALFEKPVDMNEADFLS